jgi:hypothetical protein
MRCPGALPSSRTLGTQVIRIERVEHLQDRKAEITVRGNSEGQTTEPNRWQLA